MKRFILSKPYHQIFLAPDGDASGGDDDKGSLKPVYDEKGKDFFKQFSSSRSDVPEEKRTEPPAAGEKPAVDGEAKEGEAGEKKPPLVQPKKPGSNIPKLVEEKRAAEKERDELRARTEKFEKEEKPVLEKKIADYEKQIAEGGHTKAEREALQAKLDAAEKKLSDREQTLVTENENLRAELIRHDIRYDPKFKETYEAPMEDKLKQSFEFVKGDEKKHALLNKAFIANNAAILAMRPEDRLAHEKERSAILSQIYESLDDFQRDDFRATVNEYIRLTKNFTTAVGNAQDTMKKIGQEREQEQTKARVQVFKTWTDHNATVAPSFDKEAVIEGELADVVKELKLDPGTELKEASEKVDKIITGRASMEESVGMLQRGRVYPVMKAKLAAQDHLIKGLRDTIAKLRGTKPRGDTPAQTSSDKGKDSKTDFYSKFKAGRRAEAE